MALRCAPPAAPRASPRLACRSHRAAPRCALSGSDSAAAVAAADDSRRPLSSVRFSFLWLSRADYFADGTVVYHDSPVRRRSRCNPPAPALHPSPCGAEPWLRALRTP